MFLIFSILITLIIIPTQTKLTHQHGKQQKPEERCGHPLGMVSGRIVGGYDVGYYKYPWFVSLFKYGEPYCGGTLVTKKSIVTAAHCYGKYINNPKGSENEYELKIGIYNVCNTHESTMRSYKASKVYIHEKYKDEDPYYDIALIVLKENVDFEPACLPSKPYGSKERPKEAFIAGYGEVKFKDPRTPCTMREARVKIYSDKVCKRMIHDADPEDDNLVNAFCAGYLEGGVDTCLGDSGGPLMVLTSGSRFVLLGLTSFGYECALKNRLGVYTDVSKFVDWIYAKTNAPIIDNPENNEDEDGDEDEDSDDYDDDDDGEKKKKKSKNKSILGKFIRKKHHKKKFHTGLKKNFLN